ncbi:MAG: 50S ribosomal protein L21 [Ktedonobacteraceae bacterium]
MPATYPEEPKMRGRKGKSMYAVIKSGGRQYQVAVGEELQVNRLVVEIGEQVRFEEVLLISNENEILIGTPLVSDALVLATATKQGRGEKLIVFKYKSKKRYRHKSGHRQELTILSIDDIVANGKSLITGEAPEFKEKAAPSTEAEEEITEAEAEAESTEATTTPEAETETKSRRRRTAQAEENAEKAEE